MNSKVYKSCVVPHCRNTSIRTPNKLFVYVPHKKSIRYIWLRLARRPPTSISLKTSIYFCEDHFDLPNDMENYMEYHVMGTVAQVRMKRGCFPSKFTCQPGRRKSTTERPNIVRIRRKLLINEHKKQNSPTKDFELGETSNSGVQESSKETAVAESDTPLRSPQPEFYIKTENVFDSVEDMSMYEDDAPFASVADELKPMHTYTLRCNVCATEIVGYRYTCVQCSDFNLCVACELNSAHPQHYVLRIPESRAHEEIEAVLAVIRLQLLRDVDPKKEPEEDLSVKIENLVDESVQQNETSDINLDDKDATLETIIQRETAEGNNVNININVLEPNKARGVSEEENIANGIEMSINDISNCNFVQTVESNAADIYLIQPTDEIITNDLEPPSAMKTPKSNAEKCREYRKRKKALTKIQQVSETPVKKKQNKAKSCRIEKLSMSLRKKMLAQANEPSSHQVLYTPSWPCGSSEPDIAGVAAHGLQLTSEATQENSTSEETQLVTTRRARRGQSATFRRARPLILRKPAARPPRNKETVLLRQQPPSEDTNSTAQHITVHSDKTKNPTILYMVLNKTQAH